MDDYENDYNAAMKEVNRLRGVAREYSSFYNRVMEAYEKQDWELIKKAIDWADE